MDKSAAISSAKLAAKVGHRMEVLVDTVDASTVIARSMADAPEIDGIVKIAQKSKEVGKIKSGDLIDVEITGSSDHDLEAKIVRPN
jgi:ribosomal protein S12 methylthiotransferase